MSEPRYALCDGCGKAVAEHKASERLETRGNKPPKIYVYCPVCWRMRVGN